MDMSNSWIGKNARRSIYARDNMICCYCEKPCITGIEDASLLEKRDRKNIASLDHIVPRYQIAQTCESDREFFTKQRDPKNLVVVCVGCNSSKQHTPLFVWAAKTNKDYYRIQKEIARRINTALE